MTASPKKIAVSGLRNRRVPTMTDSQHRQRWADESDVPYGLCQCGCGERTGIATRSFYGRDIYSGRPLRFVHGHNDARGMDGPPMVVLEMMQAYDPRPLSRVETAEVMGVSKQAVYITERNGLRRMRRECIRVGLSWHDFCHVVGFTQPEAGE
jgi:hypothetical protein